MQATVAFAAQYLFIVVILLEVFYLAIFHRHKWKTLVAAALMIGGLAFIVSLVANRLIQDPRPFVEQGFKPVISSSTDNGFPSDHVLLLATTAAIMMVVSFGAGLLGLLGAVVVGLARVYVGVHHLLDVVGSLVIVAFASGVYAGIMHILKVLRLSGK